MLSPPLGRRTESEALKLQKGMEKENGRIYLDCKVEGIPKGLYAVLCWGSLWFLVNGLHDTILPKKSYVGDSG